MADIYKAAAARHAVRLCESLCSIREGGDFCDVHLSLGSEKCAAHQAVLAAVSEPLRQKILASTQWEFPIAPELAMAPQQPLEIELKTSSLASSSSLRSFVEYLYGNSQQFELQTALQVEDLDLAAGLQKLQENGLLCDILLHVYGDYIPAHKVVLAAASKRLRDLLTNSLPSSPEDSGALELSLCCSSDSVRVMLGFVYCNPNWAEGELSKATIRGVLALATEYHLWGLEMAMQEKLFDLDTQDENQRSIEDVLLALSACNEAMRSSENAVIDSDKENSKLFGTIDRQAANAGPRMRLRMIRRGEHFKPGVARIRMVRK